jgi:hypothetical protein
LGHATTTQEQIPQWSLPKVQFLEAQAHTCIKR